MLQALPSSQERAVRRRGRHAVRGDADPTSTCRRCMVSELAAVGVGGAEHGLDAIRWRRARRRRGYEHTSRLGSAAVREVGVLHAALRLGVTRGAVAAGTGIAILVRGGEHVGDVAHGTRGRCRGHRRAPPQFSALLLSHARRSAGSRQSGPQDCSGCSCRARSSRCRRHRCRTTRTRRPRFEPVMPVSSHVHMRFASDDEQPGKPPSLPTLRQSSFRSFCVELMSSAAPVSKTHAASAAAGRASVRHASRGKRREQQCACELPDSAVCAQASDDAVHER